MQTNSIGFPTASGLASYPAPLSTTYLPNTPLSTGANVDVLRRGSLAATIENCRAILAYSAMENITMLSLMATRCYQVSPFSEDYCSNVLAAYTAGAVQCIRNF